MYQKQDRQTMEKKGWQFSDRESQCNHCNAPIVWGRSPDGRNYSFTPNTADFHLKACTGSQPAAKPTPGTHPVTSPPPAQPLAAATPAPAANDLQATVAELAAAVKGLTAELARRTPASAAPTRQVPAPAHNASVAELEAMRCVPVPLGVRKLAMRWRPRQAMPDIREIL